MEKKYDQNSVEDNLNKLRDRAFECAKKNGIYNYSNKHLLMLVITKISAFVECLSNKKHANINGFCTHTPGVINSDMNIYIKEYEKYIKDTVEDNLADVVIRLLDFAGVKKIDIDFKKYLSDGSGDYFKYITFIDLAYQLCGILSIDSNVPRISGRLVNTSLYSILKWCEFMDIDIFQHLDLKMIYNEQKNIYLK